MLIYLCIYSDNGIVCENKGCENHQNHPRTFASGHRNTCPF